MRPFGLFRLLSLLLAGTFAAVLLSACDTGDPGGADTAEFEAALTGAAEVPDAVFTEGSGSADFEVNAAGDALIYSVSLADIDSVTQGHIHIGGPDENGPVVAFLFQFTEGADGSGEGEPQSFDEETTVATDTLTAEDVIARPEANFDGSLEALIAALEAGDAYANVHSVSFPAGEVRGQINDNTDPSFEQTINVALAGANEVPPVETEASGSSTLSVNVAGDALAYTVSLADIDDVTQGHIHLGGPDENGPVVAFLFQFTENADGSGGGDPQSFEEETVVAEGTIAAEDLIARPEAGFDGSIEAFLNAVTRGEAYVNVHSVAFPAGEVRGQTVNSNGDGDDDGDGDGETADVTITVDNVGASAWEVTSVEGADGVAATGEDNPGFTLATGTRYRIESGGEEGHPFAFQDADEDFLLVQNFSDEEGSFESDEDVNFASDDDGITFTLTEDLADEIARYLCTIHRGSMNGTVSVGSEED